MIELSLYEHWVLNCLVRNRAHFYYDTIPYSGAPDITTVKELYHEHFEQLFNKPVETVTGDYIDQIEHRANTLIDKLLSLDPNSYKNKRTKRSNYQVFDLH
ncbi:hypothetical protein Thini_2766 [Thiothrix nivea DSM 5205]|uniref:Uncharacterized protein n=1 Tax=Thiothrix nivea (strain ATCC 35100 / DSM 5205 / JP2) TaxID=870187 RepID=A0A656HFY2_THINJ|nr:hypothetical protein Thini_2766 [Thiothrix nivea DSM 5205]